MGHPNQSGVRSLHMATAWLNDLSAKKGGWFDLDQGNRANPSMIMITGILLRCRRNSEGKARLPI